MAQSGRLQTLLEAENEQLKKSVESGGGLSPEVRKNLALTRTAFIGFVLAMVGGTVLYVAYMVFTYRYWLFSAYAADQQRFFPS